MNLKKNIQIQYHRSLFYIRCIDYYILVILETLDQKQKSETVLKLTGTWDNLFPPFENERTTTITRRNDLEWTPQMNWIKGEVKGARSRSGKQFSITAGPATVLLQLTCARTQ